MGAGSGLPCRQPLRSASSTFSPAPSPPLALRLPSPAAGLGGFPGGAGAARGPAPARRPGRALPLPGGESGQRGGSGPAGGWGGRGGPAGERARARRRAWGLEAGSRGVGRWTGRTRRVVLPGGGGEGRGSRSGSLAANWASLGEGGVRDKRAKQDAEVNLREESPYLLICPPLPWRLHALD